MDTLPISQESPQKAKEVISVYPVCKVTMLWPDIVLCLTFSVSPAIIIEEKQISSNQPCMATFSPCTIMFPPRAVCVHR